MDVKFYHCLTCGNIICKVVDSGVVPVCCGSEMILMEAKSVDNGLEKHLPHIEWLDDMTLRVKIGSQPHPCTKEHFIQMIALQTVDGIDIRILDPQKCLDERARKEELAHLAQAHKEDKKCGLDLACRIEKLFSSKDGELSEVPVAWPEQIFHCNKKDAIGVYAYCNLHGLWHKALR